MFDDYDDPKHNRIIVDTAKYVQLKLEETPKPEQDTEIKEIPILSVTTNASVYLKILSIKYLMRKNSIKFSIFFLLLGANVYGQESSLPKTKVTLSYFGETITHPGLNIGFEYYHFQSKTHQMILATNIGGYIHIRNNSSFFIRGQWGQRITFNCGVFIDEFMGLGYLHQFVNGGQNYEVLPNGAVVKTLNTGRPMIMPSVAIGTGYDFSKKTKCNVVYFLRPELFWKAPFNGYYLTHLALNTGVIFKLNKKNAK